MKTLPLSQGKVALVDDADYGQVSGFKWTALNSNGRWYAYRKEGKRTVYLHRFLLQTEQYVDHRNHDGLDNQRENLRSSSPTQNQANRRKSLHTSSRFKGVAWFKRSKCWQVHIQIAGRQTFLGNFKIEEEAARAYDRAAREKFGEFALTNFPE